MTLIKVALSNFLTNLRAGIKLLFFRASAIPQLQVSVQQLLALWGLGLLLHTGLSFRYIGTNGHINLEALPALLYPNLCILFTAWLGSRVTNTQQHILRASLALSASSVISGLMWVGLSVISNQTWEALDKLTPIIWGLPFAWFCLSAVVSLVRNYSILPEHRVGAILAVTFGLIIPQHLINNDASLWQANYPPPNPAVAAAQRAVTDENILYQQTALLQKSLDAIRPGKLGKPELFLLALAGHGAQDVFLREVTSVKQLFDERFETKGHSLILANNPNSLTQYPLATVTALRQALRTIGQKMNREEDVLFLFLTSHGAANFRFDLSLWPYTLHELSPAVLLSLLDEANIRHRILIISACYSGGFVPPLSNPDTLVISAARADRNSHGCSHEADWTFFGKAYFDEALRHTHNFISAFQMAQKAIAAREKAEDLVPSEPQIAIGKNLQKHLEQHF